MISGAEHGLGQAREERREHDQREQHERAGEERRERRARSGRLVERARREAGRDGHALEHACADVRHALGDRLLVDVDEVSVPRGERARVAGRLREADQQEGNRRGRDRRSVILEDVGARELGSGEPARHVPDEGDPMRAEIEHGRRDEPGDDEHERARDRRREEADAEDQRQRGEPHGERQPVDVVERLQPRPELAPGARRRSSRCR